MLLLAVNEIFSSSQNEIAQEDTDELMSATSTDEPVFAGSAACVETPSQAEENDVNVATSSIVEENAIRLASNRTFLLDEVDVTEQKLIQARLTKNLDLAFERAVEEAIRRSLSETASEQSLAMDGDDLVSRGSDNSHQIGSYLDSLHLDDASAVSVSDDPVPVRPNGHAAAAQNNGADSDDEGEAMPRSRRSQFQHSRSTRSERRPSLEMISAHQGERRPSLERINAYQSERRPSLERVGACRSERRPSLERMNGNQSERRPSLERVNGCRSERRSSLERVSAHRSERRPSLERMENNRSERRPSLERLQQCGLERRPSLERRRRAEASSCVMSAHDGDDADGPGQGINTLRPWPLNYHGIPTNWDMSSRPSIESYTHYKLVQLSPVDREYNAITVDFEEAGLRVHRVERIQNVVLLDKFKTEKDHLLRLRPPDFELNERYLYHGTQAAQERLCEEGLDARLSFQGCFGRGIYFSDNPRKCMQYANVQGNHAATIVVCRVLLGESKVYDTGVKDPNLKREPEKPAAKGGWRFYDSVQGVPMDYPEFVVYENRRAMIEYIITFEEKEYRPPPTLRSYSQTPSLYKVDPEPIILPISEDELDKMYMLCPDTDSDGSCDEHTREVEKLRDNVRRGKAKRLGILYRPPTAEEKRYERLHWKRVCYYSCPPNSPLFDMMIRKKQEEKAARKLRKQKEREEKAKAGHGTGDTISASEHSDPEGEADLEEGASAAVGAVWGTGSAVRRTVKQLASDTEEAGEEEVENESVAEVLSNLIADFLSITASDDVKRARRYIMESGMDLDKALCQFFNET